MVKDNDRVGAMATGERVPEADEPLPLGEVAQGSVRGRRPQSKHRVRSRHERAGRRAGVPVKPISLSLPSSLATAWRTYSQTQRHSLVDVMLDAIVANKDTLNTLVRAQQASARAERLPVSDGLFLRTADPADLAGSADPYVTVPLRMLSTNVDTLDSLAFETAAESRSQLVVAALGRFLVAKGVLNAVTDQEQPPAQSA